MLPTRRTLHQWSPSMRCEDMSAWCGIQTTWFPARSRSPLASNSYTVTIIPECSETWASGTP